MTERIEHEQDEKGLSARQLILVFLTGVAVCGVFFALGFLVGYNERTSKLTPATERVAPSSAIPPTVNPPPDTSQPASKEPAADATTVAPPEAAPPLAGGAKSSSTEAPAPAAPPPAKPETHGAESAAPVPASGEVGVGLTVQVAASRAKQDAEALVKILKDRGYPVFLVTPEYAHANDNLYRVQVGPFRSREDAEKVRKKLSEEGFKPFIKK